MNGPDHMRTVSVPVSRPVSRHTGTPVTGSHENPNCPEVSRTVPQQAGRVVSRPLKGDGTHPPSHTTSRDTGTPKRDTVPGHLNKLRQNGISIVLDPDTRQPRLDGPATPHDRAWAHRHTHALRLAADGNHTTWWTAVHTGNHHNLHTHHLPVAATDNEAFACAGCGQPADHLDTDLLPWCPTHRDPPGDDQEEPAHA